MGYDFLIEYKKGNDNKVVDTLSRVEEDGKEDSPTLFIITSIPKIDL